MSLSGSFRRFAFAAAMCAIPVGVFALGDGKIHIFFVDCGQGDAALVVGPQGLSCMVDGGPSTNVAPMSAAMNYAIAQGLTNSTLDYVVVSHLHTDHIQGLPNFYDAFPGGLVKAYDRGGSYSSGAYTNYDNKFGAPGLNKRATGATFSLGTGCNMTFIGHPTAGSGDENNNGVIYRLDFGSFKCSFAGDLGTTYEVPWAASMGKVDHYKVNHHGSNTSSYPDWMSVIHPETHTFSYGIGNSYGHPTQTAINNCAAVGSARYDTPLNHSSHGNWVELVSDGGATYSVNGSNYSIPGAVTLKINEALPAPSSGNEWVEIYNAGTSTIDLTGWTLDDVIGGGSAPVSLSGSVAPGAYFVYNYTSAVLNNTGDDINLINPLGSVVDTTTYGSAPSGSTWARMPNGTGAFQWDATPTKSAANN